MTPQSTKTNKYMVLWAIPVACIISFILPVLFPFLAVTDRWVNDIQISYLNEKAEVSEDIVILTITEKDLESFPYRSPVDRAFLKDVIETLKARDVKALFMDILLDQPTEPEKDLALKETLDQFDKPMVISYATIASGLTPLQIAYQAAFVTPEKRGLPNLVKTRNDTTARSVFIGMDVEGQGYIKSVPISLAQKMGYDNLPNEEVPIRWRGNAQNMGAPFKVFPVSTLKLLPAKWFKDKVVFLGFDLPLHDRHRTPFTVALDDKGVIPGLVILAHIYSQLVEGSDYISVEMENILNVIAVLMAAGLAALPILMLSGAMVYRILAFALLLTSIVGFVLIIYQYFGVSVSLTKSTFAFAFSVLLMEFWRRRQEEKQKRFVHDAFGMFVDKEYVDILINDPSKISLTGDRKHMAYIFTDIAGFTTFSEKNDATVVSETLNQYLSECSDVIFANKGTIIDFIGDAIFVVFNAPIEQDNYERLAIECALGLADKSEEFRNRPEAVAMGFGRTRIGVHSGISIIGNMGSKDRMKFSALGDTINTTARLEGLNKYLGTTIMMSEDVAHAYDHKRLLGRFIVKGRAGHLGVYEPLTDNHPAADYLEDYEQVYCLMAEEKPAALDALKALGEKHPEDSVIAFHIKRLEKGETTDIVRMEDK